jgi:glutamate dehydrogenase
VNGDFVDNAAGVAMSDREVNLKVLLGLAISQGKLPPDDRDSWLVEVRDTVAGEVLAQVGLTVVALDNAATSSALDLPAYEVLMTDLENGGLLDTVVEALPQPEELARRKQAGAGLSRPELAVLLACARSETARSIEASAVAEDHAFWPCAYRYFPEPMRERFGDLVSQHPLFRQLLASELANEVVDRMGALWAHEVAEETARQLWEVAAAYWVARQVLGADELYDEMDKAMPGISADDETALRASVSACLGELARWYLARRGPLDPGESIARDKPIVARISELTTGKPVSASGPRGLPVEVTSRLERLKALRAAGELAHVARATERGPDVVLAAHLAVSEGLSLPVLLAGLAEQRGSGRWERWQAHVLAQDLARARAEGARNALHSYPEAGGADAVQMWLTDGLRGRFVDRARSLVQQLERSAQASQAAPALPGLALLAVAARAVVDALEG